MYTDKRTFRKKDKVAGIIMDIFKFILPKQHLLRHATYVIAVSVRITYPTPQHEAFKIPAQERWAAESLRAGLAESYRQ
jgi:hypothetical protein